MDILFVLTQSNIQIVKYVQSSSSLVHIHNYMTTDNNLFFVCSHNTAIGNT